MQNKKHTVKTTQQFFPFISNQKVNETNTETKFD